MVLKSNLLANRSSQVCPLEITLESFDEIQGAMGTIANPRSLQLASLAFEHMFIS